MPGRLLVPGPVNLVVLVGVEVEGLAPPGPLGHLGRRVAAAGYGLGLQRLGVPGGRDLGQPVEVFLHGELADHQAVLLQGGLPAAGGVGGPGELELAVGVGEPLRVGPGPADVAGVAGGDQRPVGEPQDDPPVAAESAADGPAVHGYGPGPALEVGQHVGGAGGQLRSVADHRDGPVAGYEAGGPVHGHAHVHVVGGQGGLGDDGGAVVVEGEDLGVGEPGLGPAQRPVLAHPDAVAPAPALEGERVPGGAVVARAVGPVLAPVLAVGQVLLGHRRLVGGRRLGLAALGVVGDLVLVLGSGRGDGQPRYGEDGR